ncbi:Replication factor-A C terminal domain-containing protein [Forsythia ovata]|uniref:Replication factor-A C terminal domain-containing protein n=1 Tax=Forsythia ovata TaxID=205694 RepID=A0ABD1QRC0_9LAMI
MFIKKNYLATTQIKLSPPSKDKVTEIGNIQGLLVVQNHFWVEARAYIRVFNQSFWYMACDICNKISSASYGEVYDCIFCKSARARASARARVFVELEDSTASINGTMIGEPAEKMMQCSARRLMALTSPDNQLQVLDEVRITIEESHFFYLKAVEKDGLADQWKYDIIFMLEPLAMTENIQEVIQPQHSSSTSQSLNSVPQPLSPPAKRLLFEVPPVSTSNKRLTEESHLHGNADTAILKLSGSTASSHQTQREGSSNNMNGNGMLSFGSVFFLVFRCSWAQFFVVLRCKCGPFCAVRKVHSFWSIPHENSY